MHHNADRAIREGLVHEGGYVNHPNDPGGPTNKGITLATFRRYMKPNATIQDLKNLTEEQAIHIYRKRYWDAISGDDLPSGVDLATYDFAINSGPSRAAKYLQKIIGANADGRIGPQTIAAAKAMAADETVNRLCDDRLAFMKRIRGGSLWKTFGRGWQRRVDEVRASALELASVSEKPKVTIEVEAGSEGFWQRLLGRKS